MPSNFSCKLLMPLCLLASQAGFASNNCVFTISGATMTLTADCSTDATLEVPDGFTLDGSSHTITAVDPSGGHFLGAVVKSAAGAASANVVNLKVTTSALANVCDDGIIINRLRGIFFDNVSGLIQNNVVENINQGVSGCKEGGAIEARGLPLTGSGPDRAVTITGNTVRAYQKNGITVNGSVAAIVTSNTVEGLGSVPYIVQNGIQIGQGATAIVRQNKISGNDNSGDLGLSCGILYFREPSVQTSENTMRLNQKNFCNFGERGGGRYDPVF